MTTLVEVLLWFAAIGCGLIAGLYFAFSVVIMPAFARIDRAQAVAAMTAINRTILATLFMPLFWGTTLAGLALAVLAAVRWESPGAAAMLAGGLIYFAGMFLVTALCNVPLNKALEAGAAAEGDPTGIWDRYLLHWTRWNHLRTLASTGATVLFVLAIALG